MFRKVQLKFFGIITAILIAIFIAVLSSVNIIMDALMERQTKIVLQQVASGVEYNDSASTFTFVNPNRHKEDKPKKENIPPATSAEIELSTESATEQQTETKTEETEALAEKQPPQSTVTSVKNTEIQAEKPEETHQEQPVRTETVHPTEPASETHPPLDWGEGGQFHDNYYPDQWYYWGSWPPPNHYYPNPWDSPWYHWSDWNEYENKDDGGRKKETDGMAYSGSLTAGDCGLILAADTDFVPILDGYTVTAYNTEMEKSHSELPVKDTQPVPKSFGSIDFFVIMADKDGKYVAALNNDELTEEKAQGYIDEIISDNDSVGMTGNLSYCAERKDNGTLMVFTDRTAEMDMMRKLKRTTVIVGIVSIIFLSAAAYFLSGLIVRPLKETFDKQKQFISDASHELKMPLTVISTNADVLSGEIGENKWLNYIHDQVGRMNVLVNDLLSLTRLENSNRDFIVTEFDLSRAVLNSALPFECRAFESRKNFVLNVDDNIKITGSEQHIKQLTGIFIDNALKYSKDGGTVRVSLTKEDNKAVLSVYNTGSGVREEEVDKLFERFYRSDESRNRSTGGYGLGLAIAKSIIDKHKFKIQVENQEGRSICFVVTM